MRRLFEGGVTKAKTLAVGGDYSRATTIRGRRLFEGGVTKAKTLAVGGDYSRATTIRGRRLIDEIRYL